NILEKIIATPLQYKPGTKTIYSDVDYMLLGLIIEKITGEREDQYVENHIYKPLGLTHLMYKPLEKGIAKNNIAATELNGNSRDGQISFNNIRRYTLQGQVHDEKAYYTMHGVSGHAGLFGNASDLAVLAQMVINRGGYGNHKVFDEDTLDEFIKPKSNNPSYGLGWRRQASNAYGWAFSGLSDASTVGHTGWTGTLTVVDPHDNTAVILLTNERNTPILKPETTATANDFAGGHYLLSKYGDIASLAFAAVNDDKQSANDAKLISLVTQRYNEI
ncbi:serine hydrolase, partial [Lactobacillus helveticus]